MRKGLLGNQIRFWENFSLSWKKKISKSIRIIMFSLVKTKRVNIFFCKERLTFLLSATEVFAGLPGGSLSVIPLQGERSINSSRQAKLGGGGRDHVPHEHCKWGQSDAGYVEDVTWMLPPCWWSRPPFTVDANNPRARYSNPAPVLVLSLQPLQHQTWNVIPSTLCSKWLPNTRLNLKSV
jgi:hypothetical protein